MMAMNRVQYQRGLSMTQFQDRYGTEQACEVAVLNARWPNGFVCSRCEGILYSRFERGGRSCWQCRRCRHQCSLLAGTIFDNTKLPLTLWFQALYVLTQTKNNVSALELMRHLGVCYRTAWRMKHKLMQAMTHREAARQLAGFVEIDDAYLGGERNGGKAGRGSENKRPFVVAVSTNEQGHPQYVVAEPVPGFTKAALTEWMARRLHPDAEVFSDGLGAFRAAHEGDHAHTVIEAGGGRAACEAEGARWVNIVMGNIKRSLDGTYHAFGFFKYAQRYLAEAAWRFNRRFELAALLPRMLVASVRCPAWAEAKLRSVPVYAG